MWFQCVHNISLCLICRAKINESRGIGMCPVHLWFKPWSNLFHSLLVLCLRREKYKCMTAFCFCLVWFLLFDTCMERFLMRNIESYHIYLTLFIHTFLIFFSTETKSNETRINKFIIGSIITWRWLIIQFNIPNSVFWLNSTACTQNCVALRILLPLQLPPSPLLLLLRCGKTVLRISNYTIFMEYINITVCMHFKRTRTPKIK